MLGTVKTVTVDIDRNVTGSFSGDDADQYSTPFDLGAEYDEVQIECPAITSSTVSLYKHGQNAKEGDGQAEVPVPIEMVKSDNTSAIWARTAGTAAGVIVVKTGGMQYGRICCNTNQGEDRSFKVRGVR